MCKICNGKGYYVGKVGYARANILCNRLWCRIKFKLNLTKGKTK